MYDKAVHSHTHWPCWALVIGQATFMKSHPSKRGSTVARTMWLVQMWLETRSIDAYWSARKKHHFRPICALFYSTWSTPLADPCTNYLPKPNEASFIFAFHAWFGMPVLVSYLGTGPLRSIRWPPRSRSFVTFCLTSRLNYPVDENQP